MSTDKIVAPIKPQEILDNLGNIIPSFVFEAVNNLLKQKFRGKPVKITQDEILDEIDLLQDRYSREDIFDNKWMDFEKVYVDNGWCIKYDKPSYRENYDSYFEFSVKKIK